MDGASFVMFRSLRSLGTADVLSLAALALWIYTTVASLFLIAEAASSERAADWLGSPVHGVFGTTMGIAALVLAILFLGVPASPRRAMNVLARDLAIAATATAVGLGLATLFDRWTGSATPDLVREAWIYFLLALVCLLPAALYASTVKQPRRLHIAGLAALGFVGQMLSLYATVVFALGAFLFKTGRRAAKRAI